MSMSIHVIGVTSEDAIERARAIVKLCLDGGYDPPEDALRIAENGSEGIDLSQCTTEGFDRERCEDWVQIEVDAVPDRVKYLRFITSH